MKIIWLVALCGATACGNSDNSPAANAGAGGGSAAAGGAADDGGGTAHGGDNTQAGAGVAGGEPSAAGAGTAGDAGAVGNAGDAGAPAADSFAVHFKYTPDWSGVTAVSVIGGFGLAGDWHEPLLALSRAPDGTFSGTARLAAGQYTYLFQTTGDAAADPATQKHLFIDPTLSAFMECPTGSPSASDKAKNPCSLLTVPQPSEAPTFHVRGSVAAGAPLPNWLVQIDREEPKSHHFGVNRAVTGADGKYDFSVAAGSYRIQLFIPDYESKTDAERTPLSMPFVRRAISTPVVIAADVVLGAADVSFKDYSQMSPVNGVASSLPVTLTFTLPAGGAKVHASIYAPRALASDPWWNSPGSTQTSASFAGTFNTGMAAEPNAVPGELYYWGVFVDSPPSASGLVWTRQSMLFPLPIKQ